MLLDVGRVPSNESPLYRSRPRSYNLLRQAARSLLDLVLNVNSDSRAPDNSRQNPTVIESRMDVVPVSEHPNLCPTCLKNLGTCF